MALSYVIHDVHIKKYLDDNFHDTMERITYEDLRDRTEPILKADYVLDEQGAGTRGVFLIV